MPAWVYRVGVAAAMVAVALAAADAAVGSIPGPTEANAKRVTPGMRLHEVEAILGGPGQLGTASGGMGHLLTAYEWAGSGGVVQVWFCGRLFDTDPGVVESVQFRRTAAPNPLERLRAWLGW